LTAYNAAATYHYSPPMSQNGNVEMATMNMGKFGTDGRYYSAKMRLNIALGFGRYEQSIKVGKGSGICTTFYLSQHDVDKVQEIAFEMSGLCQPEQKPCGTQSVLTCVWYPPQTQITIPDTKLWVGDTVPNPIPDTTGGWGLNVYRYMFDWDLEVLTWSVDRTGSGNNYTRIRTESMKDRGYDQSKLHVFMSFWAYYSPRGDAFLEGRDGTVDFREAGCGYQ